MHLKRLKRCACPGGPTGQYADYMQQEDTASQLLAELEGLTEGPGVTEADEGLGIDLCSNVTPGLHEKVGSIRRSNGFTSSAKRRRKTQLVPIFGSQDENDDMQQRPTSNPEEGSNKQDDPLAWLQQTNAHPRSAGVDMPESDTICLPQACGGGTSTVVGIRSLSGAASRVPANKGRLQQPQQQQRTPTNNSRQRAGSKQRIDLHLVPAVQQVGYGNDLSDIEDEISDSDNEPAAASVPQHNPGLRPTLVSPVGSKQGVQQQQQQQNPRLLPPRLSSVTRLMSPLVEQQPSRQASAPAAGTALQQQTIISTAAAALDEEADWLPPRYRQPQQEPPLQDRQQQRQQHLSMRLTLSASKTQLGSTQKRPFSSLPAAAAREEEPDWMPPKDRKPAQQQQQQQPYAATQLPLSASKPALGPIVSRLSSQLPATAGSHTPIAASGPGRPAKAAGSAGFAAAAAAGANVGMGNAGGSHEAPWWMVLDDFVPVEVLVQEAVNPRDGAIVHINYKSQFKDGGTTGKRASTATAAAGSRKKSTNGSRRTPAAAAAAPAGFVTAGAYAAAGGGESGGRGKKGRKGRGSGSGSGKAKGSGGRKRKGGGSGGKWRFRHGRKVFIDGSGKQLTGSAAWGRYQQSRGQS